MNLRWVPLTYTGKVLAVGLFLILSFGVLALQQEAPRQAPATQPSKPATVPAKPEPAVMDLGKVETVYDRAAYWLWSLESSCGTDESWRIEGEAGERGEFRTTPIWEQDFSDIFSRDPAVDEPEQMLSDVADWLWFRAHSYNLPHPHTVERLVRLYQEGH